MSLAGNSHFARLQSHNNEVKDMNSINITLQPFDTDLFSFPVYKAALRKHSDIVDLDKSVPKDAGLVSIRVPCEWENAMKHTKFRKIEHLIYFERTLNPSDQLDLPSNTRLAINDDVHACSKIAGNCFNKDRYHADQHLDDRIADHSKYTWAKNNILGRCDTNFIVELEDQIVGFISCLRETTTAVIDLIGVTCEAQGKGIGTLLVKTAISHYAKQVSSIKVGTQKSNTASIKLYGAAGFIKIDEAITFHWTPTHSENI